MSDEISSEESIFEGAMKVPVPERPAYLLGACSGNAVLRNRVETLLAAFEQAGSFLEKPVAEFTQAFGGGVHVGTIAEGPGEVIGRYKLLQKIGEGGMGVVYMADQESPVRRRVAMKIIKPGMDSAQVIARFEAERQALAMMDHQNIARVFDAGTTASGRPYFVMELVHGVPITQHCDSKKMPLRDRLELFVTVCQAIQHAHQKGIIHRDLKPSNVLVAIYDGKAAPKVIDFGVAKALHQRLTEKTLFTQFGGTVGTPEYMSPEQTEIDMLGTDTRSDIYTLGVMLYELLTGTTPLDLKKLRGEGYSRMMQTIRDVEPLKPSTRLHDSGEALALISEFRGTEPRKLARLMAGDLDWIVMKALEKDRSRRYETANALARDIQRYLNDEPVEATPPNTWYRMRKLARRYQRTHRTPLRVVTALLLLLAVAAVLGVRLAMLGRQSKQAGEELVRLQEKLQQQNIRASIEGAMTAIMNGDDVEARKQVEQAELLGASAWQIRLVQGGLFVELDRNDEALWNLEQAVRLKPDSVAAHALLALAYYDGGKVNEWRAESDTLQGLRCETDQDYLLKGWNALSFDPAQAAKDMAEATRLHDSALARLMLAYARAEAAVDDNYNEKTLDRALRDLGEAETKLNAQFDDPAVAWTSLGVYQNAGALYGSLALQAARQGNQRKAEEYEGKRVSAMAMADACYKKMRKNLTSSRMARQCARYLTLTGQFESLLKYCDDLAATGFSWTQQWVPYWKVYALYRLDRVDEAFALTQEFQKRVGPQMLWDLAFVLAEEPGEKKSAFDSAIAWEKAMQSTGGGTGMRPGQISVMSVNEIRLLLGRKAEAMAVAKSLLTPEPHWPIRGGWYVELAKFQAGELTDVELLKKAENSVLSQCEAHFNIGLWLLCDGDRRGARAHLAEAAQSPFVYVSERRWSSAFLQRMDADSKWPPWIPVKSADPLR